MRKLHPDLLFLPDIAAFRCIKVPIMDVSNVADRRNSVSTWAQ